MSEPMSSGEIEDVLSSIRRLVSEDLRPGTRNPDTLAPADVSAQPAAGKLLLTPALRVVSNSLGEAATAAPLSAAPVGANDGPFGQMDDVAEDTGAVDTAEPAKARAAPAADEDWLPEAPVDAVEGHWDHAGVSRVVSEISAGVSDSDEDWEPEVGDAPVSGLSWQAPEWIEEAEVVEDSVEAAQRDAVARVLADKAEAAAVADIMARAEKARVEAETAKAEMPKDAEDIFAEDEGYFDETVLRDLVRDLIREELSGALGERITRNVRKLVRAEINRAMTARDFD